MIQQFVILAGILVLAVTVTVVIVHCQASANTAPDLDRQVNDVARSLHPAKLAP